MSLLFRRSSQDSSSGDGGGKTNDEVDSLPPLPLFTHLYTLRDTFDPNTVRHIQNWPSEPYEKQVLPHQCCSFNVVLAW